MAVINALGQLHAVAITGIGHISHAGASYSEMNRSLKQDRNPTSDVLFEGYQTFRAPDVDMATFGVPKRERRFLGPSMKLAISASHEAINDAGLFGLDAELAKLDLIVACGAGVRDEVQDCRLVKATLECENQEAEIHARLSSSIRPTEFLTQLPNLAAANICMLLGVGGSTRTLMGGEAAGLHVLKMAVLKIASGLRNRQFVGGVNFGQCFYTNYALAQAGVLQRDGKTDDTHAIGSSSTFLVLENLTHAQSRQATIHGVITDLQIGQKGDANETRSDVSAPPVKEDQAQICISDFANAKNPSGAVGAPDLYLNKFIGHTREDAIFGGLAAGCALMQSDAKNGAAIELQHRSVGSSRVTLERATPC